MGDDSITAVLARARASFERGFALRKPVCSSCSASAVSPPNARSRETGEVCVVCGKPALPSDAIGTKPRVTESTNLIPRLAARGIPYKDIERLVEDGGQLLETGPLTATRGWYADLAAAQPGHERMRPKHPPYFLLLAGGVGIGKTTACSWFIAQPPQWRGHISEALRSKTSEINRPCYVAVSDMQSATLRDKDDVARWKHALSLAIDDIGAEAETHHKDFSVVLNAVLEFRHRQLLPTMLTTNLAIDQATTETRYGVRYYERLKEAAGTVFNFDDLSMRGAS